MNAKNGTKKAQGKKYIAIDFGAESGRLIVGILHDGKLTMNEIHRFRTQGTLVRGELRWNVMRFWEEILRGLKKYHEFYGEYADGIGIDSWGVSPVGLDEYDQLAYSPFHYRAELIADPMLERLKSEVGEDFIFRTTGIQFMGLNTSTQVFAMEKKYPNLLKRVKTFFLIPDYFYFLLTGKKITEYTNASTSQMIDVFKREWSQKLLEKISPSLRPGNIPPLHPTGTKLGTITPEVQKLTNLKDIPVHVVATHDTGSAIAAIPHADQEKGWAYLSSGTWSLLGTEIEKPIVNERIQQYNLTNEGGVEGTIRLLKNIMGLWLIQESKREWEREGKSLTYSEIMELAKNAPPCRSVLFPDDRRFFSPDSMVEEIQGFCKETDQPIPETTGQIARCIFESLACRYKQVIGILEDLTGTTLEQIHIVGGGSQNTLLSQMTADITGKVVITGPVEATAIGNLLMQAKSAGDIRNLHELRTIVGSTFKIETLRPTEDPDTLNRWEQYYKSYLKLDKI